MVFCGGDFAFRSADHSVCMFDRRNLTSDGVGSPVHKFEEHKAPVSCVQWCPDKSSVFGSSVEDGCKELKNKHREEESCRKEEEKLKNKQKEEERRRKEEEKV
ncbi:putative transcription factor WD40-like family [Helianthus debilis subsp. tardiflorus]